MNKKQEYRDFIIELAKLFRPDTYVEIGARFGYVFNEVSKYAKRSIAVDIIDLDRIEKRQGIECFKMTSREFCSKWVDKIDLLFIDADHSSEAVFRDFMNLVPCVKENTGLILLHDTYPIKEELLRQDRCGDAWKVAKLIHEEYKQFEIVTLPGPWAGLSIIRKAKCHGWMDK